MDRMEDDLGELNGDCKCMVKWKECEEEVKGLNKVESGLNADGICFWYDYRI